MGIEVMVDLETLSVRPNAAIIAIGAVKFDPRGAIGVLGDPGDEEYKHFYVNVEMHSLSQMEFHIDGRTIAWWLGEPGEDGKSNVSEEARMKLFDAPMDICVALHRFYDWFGGVSLPTWGNGAAFDNVVLRSAFEKFDSVAPWTHREDRCFRTMKALFPDVPYVKPQVPHDALQDAAAQAVHLQKLFNRIVTQS